MASTLNERTDHPADDALERYSLNGLTGNELDQVEDHIFCCSHCQARLSETDSWVGLMRAALHGESGRETSARKPMAFAIEYGLRRKTPTTAPPRWWELRPANSGANRTEGEGWWAGDQVKRLAWVGMALAIVAVVAPNYQPASQRAPVDVAMVAERGTSSGVVPAGGPVRLLVPPSQAEGAVAGAVVGMDGRVAIEGQLRPILTIAGEPGLALDVPDGLAAGRYWFRLLGPDGAPVRESELIVR